MRKKILSVMLTICMVLAFMPQMVFAAEAGNPYALVGGTDGAGETEGPDSLIDGEFGTKWCVTSFRSAYIIFSTASPVNVSGYSITTGDDNFENKGRNPKNWTLYGCNATENPGRDSKSWTAIHSVTDDTVLQDKNYKTYNYVFDKTETAYQYYKLEISAIKSGAVMQMSEFALTDCSHSWSPETVAPTCKEEGYTATICTKCNVIREKTNFTTVVEHDYSGTDGTCIFCGYKQSDFVHKYDISTGNVIITDDDKDSSKIKVSYGGGQVVNNIDPSQTITVTGSTTASNASSYELKVETAKPVTIRAKELSIDSSNRNDAYAMVLNGGGTGEQNSADVKLILEGKNSFIGGFGKAGITVGPGKTLTIEGSGTVIANGGINGAGIGGENGGSGGDITINGGTVIATGKNGGAGVGGGNNGNGGYITISGGTVIATSGYSAGIGGAGSGSSGTFSTAKDGIAGNAVIFTKSISDQSDKTNWSGIIFEGDSGKVYGASVTPTDNFTIKKGKTLTIDNEKSLLIPEDVAMVNAGTINNSGKIYVDGTFTGTADNLYYPLTLVNVTASGDISEHNSKNYAKAGSTIELSAAPEVGKIITWNTSPTVEISSSRFTMPKDALTVTARWVDCYHDGTMTHFDEVPATYSETGVKEYWECDTCKALLSDKDKKTVIPDLDVWKAGDGKIDKLIPPKTDSVTSDKDGNVSVFIEKSITTNDGVTGIDITDNVAEAMLAGLESSESKSVVITAVTRSSVSGPGAAKPGTSIQINLPESAVKKLAEVEGIKITIVTDNGSIVLDEGTLEAIASKSGDDGKATLVIDTVEQTGSLLKLELTLKTSEGEVSDFGSGSVEVTVAISDELKDRNPVCVYIDEHGIYHLIGGKLNEDGTFTFASGHFSTYAIMPEEDAEAVIKVQTADAQKAAIKEVKPSVSLTTKKVKKGIKVNVKVPASKKADKTGVIIYRSQKKSSGYVLYKKVRTSGSSYTVTNTKNLKGKRLTKGRKYYYKARAYKVIDGKTYYGPMSAVKYAKAR